MSWDTSLYYKNIQFYRLHFPKKNNENTKLNDNGLSFISLQERKFHKIIRQILKDFQYFAEIIRQELNLIEGQRVLKNNGVKIIKENNTYYIEKYVTRQENIISRVFSQKSTQKTEAVKIQFVKSEALTDPKYFLSLLGYTTKQKQYFQYFNLQCYKCPVYGIQIVIYQKRDQIQYVMIDSVCNHQGKNKVANFLIQKLQTFIDQQNDIDPYTLKPRGLKPGKSSED